MKNGWSGSSMISVSRPLWELPDRTSPPSCNDLVVGRVDLPAVPVPLLDDRPRRSAFARQRAGHDVAGLRAQAHGGAQVGHVLLLGQQVDHGVRRGGIELARVRALETADVARELDHRALQAEADPEERDAALARVAHGRHLALHAPHAEAARDQDAVDVRERLFGRGAAEVVGRDPAGSGRRRRGANPPCFSASITDR